MRGSVVLVASWMTCSLAMAESENWPHWRGPTHHGIGSERNLPVEWGPDENVAWRIPMTDRSGSTPIIWNDIVFLNVADAGELYLWALNRKDGSLRWKQFLSGGDRRQRKQNVSSRSPVTDGEHVWVMTGTGILKAFDFTGKEIWARNVQQDYGPFGLNWGYASSPLLHDRALYVQVLHGMKTDEPSYLLRIDAATGETIWHVERPTNAIRESPDSYTTPALVEVDGGKELVITGGDVVTGHDLETGEEFWRVDGLNPENDPNYRIVASPVVLDDIIYAPTRVRPMLVIRAGGRGDVTKSHLLWDFNDGPDVPTPVTDGQYLYVVNDRGIMFCLDARSGETVWGRRRIASGIYSASPVLADGKIYITSEDGITTAIKAGPSFEVLAENNLESYTLSSPAISRGQIFLRTEDYLYVIGESTD